MKNFFPEVWDLHFKWGQEVLFNNTQELDSVEIISSQIPGEYYNFAIPKTSDPNDLNLDEIKNKFEKLGEKPTFFLLESQQHEGFVECLVRNRFILESRDAWMGFDTDSDISPEVKSEIVDVTPENFNDFESVLATVFSDFPGNAKYLEISQKTIIGELVGSYPGLMSEMYLIYEDGKPVAGAGMFYSKEGNFAYLHNAGTLEEYREKGYQSDLLRFRTKKALNSGINRIYSSVEQGSQSWINCIKNGFFQMHVGNTFVKK